MEQIRAIIIPVISMLAVSLSLGCAARPATSAGGATAVPAPSYLFTGQDGEILLGPVQNNAYGLGVHSDATGRPFQWAPLPSHNPTGYVDPLLQVTPNAYGPGIGMDQYGRPVTAHPWP